jgi:nicotinate-nucleotide adenylyltransferase
MKIAILGGAFNPPTIGHKKISEVILSLSLVDEVWLMPCYGHQFKAGLEDSEHRHKMCKFMESDKVTVFDFEIKNRLDGKLYNTVEFMLKDKKLSENEYFFITGLDNALTITSWYNYSKLLNSVKFIVVNRRGVELKSDNYWFQKNGNVFIKEHDIPEISSTIIRAELKSDCKPELILEDVYDYIKKNKLYS